MPPKEIVPIQLCPPGEVLVSKLLVTDETTDDQILQGLIGLEHIARKIDYFAPEDAEPTKFLVAIGSVSVFMTSDSDAHQKFDEFVADRARTPRFTLEVSERLALEAKLTAMGQSGFMDHTAKP